MTPAKTTDPVSARETDLRFMRMALGMARRGLGRVWPNPAVGCVLVREGRVVGRGATGKGGRPHAETQALAEAGKAAEGASAYVTLEPCAHEGQTPPCAGALVAAGIARAVVATTDPDPRVNGRGLAALREGGIDVTLGSLENEARALNAGFLSRIERGRPYLTLKLAMTLDGRIATAEGESKWITGALARREVHLMRAQSDGVLVGAGTARSDNPRLDVREMGLEDASPVRIVVTGGLGLTRRGHLGESAGALPLWLCHHGEADQERIDVWRTAGADLIEVPFQEDGQLDLTAMMRALGQRGLTRILCEGGGRLAAALVEAGLVDEIVCYSAGIVIGEDGLPGIGGMKRSPLADTPRFTLVETAQVGPDLRSRWRADAPM